MSRPPPQSPFNAQYSPYMNAMLMNYQYMSQMMAPSMLGQAGGASVMDLSRQLEQTNTELAKPTIDPAQRQRLSQMKVMLEQQIRVISMPMAAPRPVMRPPPMKTPTPVQQIRKPSISLVPPKPTIIASGIGNVLAAAQREEDEEEEEVKKTIQVKSIKDAVADSLLSKDKVRELMGKIDPEQTMDMDVEELFLDLATNFVKDLTGLACKMAVHRQSKTLSVKDASIPLEKRFQIRIPGFSHSRARMQRNEALRKNHKAKVADIRKEKKKN